LEEENVNLNSIVQEVEAAKQQQATGNVRASAQTTGSSASTSSSSSTTADATITADDFLTLLVSELQNQDPTADTDPNEYVDQLVDVNSLQQLISINQEVGSLDPSTGSSSTGTSSSSVHAVGAAGTPAAQPANSSENTPAKTAAASAFASYAAALQPGTPSSAHSLSTPQTTSHAPINSAIPASLWPSANLPQ
jgi:flagellar basal-body rod modification protein FlgD